VGLALEANPQQTKIRGFEHSPVMKKGHTVSIEKPRNTTYSSMYTIEGRERYGKC